MTTRRHGPPRRRLHWNILHRDCRVPMWPVLTLAFGLNAVLQPLHITFAAASAQLGFLSQIVRVLDDQGEDSARHRAHDTFQRRRARYARVVSGPRLYARAHETAAIEHCTGVMIQPTPTTTHGYTSSLKLSPSLIIADAAAPITTDIDLTADLDSPPPLQSRLERPRAVRDVVSSCHSSTLYSPSRSTRPVCRVAPGRVLLDRYVLTAIIGTGGIVHRFSGTRSRSAERESEHHGSLH